MILKKKKILIVILIAINSLFIKNAKMILHKTTKKIKIKQEKIRYKTLLIIFH